MGMSVKEALDLSGLSVAEYAALSGVSRVAANSWARGGKVNELRVPKLDKLNAALRSAVEAGDLPLEVGRARSKVAAQDRFDKIRQIVIKHLRQLAPPV